MTATDSYKVLVVDDDHHIRELARAALQRSGMQCDTAKDGAHAWEQINSSCFNAIVTDLKMPHRNGHSLCVDVMQLLERPVVVVLTGIAEPKLAQDLRSRGVDDIQYKPINYSVFASRIKELVEIREESIRARNGGKYDQRSGSSGIEDAATETGSDKKRCVAVMMADWSRGREIASFLLSDTVCSEVPQGVDELSDLMQARPVDLLIVENELRGFLSGADIVGKLNGLFSCPDVILLTQRRELLHSTRSESLVRMVLPSDQAPSTIAEAARSLLDERAKCDSLIPKRARELVRRMGDVAPLPELLLKLLSYLRMDDNTISLEDLAADIRTDCKSTVDLLKFTNSASNGLRHNVSDVLDALKLNGPKRTISLLLSSSLLTANSILAPGTDGDFRRWYTQRSVLIANTASTVAKCFEPVPSEMAFILGLLQDVGVLVLERLAPRRYRAIRERMSRSGQTELTLLEQDEFQLTHAEVSAALMDSWGMQRSMILPVLSHHDPQRWDEMSEESMAYVRVMQAGELLANVALLQHPSRLHKLNMHLSEFGTRDSDSCRACIAEAVTRTTESCRMFSVEQPDMGSLGT